MENRFSANILLCQEIIEDRNFEGIFNNIILEDDETIEFDIAIFLTKNIEEIKDEMFLLDLAFDEESGTHYHPIGTTLKSCDNKGKSIEVSAFKSVKVDFVWEGLYRLEFRRCQKHVDINSLDNDEIVTFIKDCKLINEFTFSVQKNK